MLHVLHCYMNRIFCLPSAVGINKKSSYKNL